MKMRFCLQTELLCSIFRENISTSTKIDQHLAQLLAFNSNEKDAHVSFIFFLSPTTNGRPKYVIGSEPTL